MSTAARDRDKPKKASDYTRVPVTASQTRTAVNMLGRFAAAIATVEEREATEEQVELLANQVMAFADSSVKTTLDSERIRSSLVSMIWKVAGPIQLRLEESTARCAKLEAKLNGRK